MYLFVLTRHSVFVYAYTKNVAVLTVSRLSKLTMTVVQKEKKHSVVLPKRQQ